MTFRLPNRLTNAVEVGDRFYVKPLLRAVTFPGKASIADRSPSGRIQGSKAQKVRLRQFARKVDRALRGVLSGRELPLILAAARPIDDIFRSVNSYPL